ncbi:MAG: hypothetical protein OER87_18430 [Gammaproteobacteria bacterium]|nr:hypothetical protein [Gammaproteobacteria bacterium]
MNRIEQLLSAGDLRTIGKSEDIVKSVKSDPKLLSDVVNAILVENPGVRMRASDAIEKITRDNPEWLMPYKRKILTKIACINQKEVRWHMAQILPRLGLTKKEREKVFKIMQSYLHDESSIVRTFAMQALTDIAIQDHSYAGKVRNQLDRLIEGGSPAMKSRGKKLLAFLDGRKTKPN